MPSACPCSWGTGHTRARPAAEPPCPALAASGAASAAWSCFSLAGHEPAALLETLWLRVKAPLQESPSCVYSANGFWALSRGRVEKPQRKADWGTASHTQGNSLSFRAGAAGLAKKAGTQWPGTVLGLSQGLLLPHQRSWAGWLPTISAQLLIVFFLSSESRASIPGSCVCLENMACPHSRPEVMEKRSPPTAFHVSTAELPRFAFPHADFPTPRRWPGQASELV